MKNTVKYIFIFLVCCVTGRQLFAQIRPLQKTVTLEVDSAHITAVLDSITVKTQVNFAYNTNIFSDEMLFTFSCRNEPVNEILTILLNNTSITFEQFEGLVILFDPQKTENSSTGIPRKEKRYDFRGNVYDAHSQLPVPFAHVTIKNESTGTITNLNGDFDLSIPPGHSDDTIEISYLGYTPEIIPIMTLDTTKLIVKLRPADIQLQEVKIPYKDPLEIINLAINRIPDNYDTDDAMLRAFFREIIKQDNQYISISEALTKIHKKSYKNPWFHDRIKITRGRRKKDVKRMEKINFTYQGGIYNTLKLDIASDRPSFIHTEEINKYLYKLENVKYFNDRLVYVIFFTQRDHIKEPLYTGNLYIDSESFAIAGAEFKITPNALDKASEYLVKKYPLRYHVMPVYSHYRVQYRYYNGMWNLAHGKSEIHMQITNHRSKKDDKTIFSTISEFLITEKQSSLDEKIKLSESTGSADIFSEQVKGYNEEFWGNNNYIKPEISLQEAYRKLSHDISVIMQNDGSDTKKKGQANEGF